jgi:hypothetical protein
LLKRKRKEVMMKKNIVLAAAMALLFTAVVLIPASLLAGAVPECEQERQKCRTDVLGNEEGWLRTMLMLSICDIAWGKCVLRI